MAGAWLTSRGPVCRGAPRAWREGWRAGGLQGLAAGQDTSLLILMRASAFPGGLPCYPHWEPSPSGRHPALGLGGVAR